MRFICVLGWDGSGKTKTLLKLKAQLNNTTEAIPATATEEARVYGELSEKGVTKKVLIWGRGDSSADREAGLKYLEKLCNQNDHVDTYVFACRNGKKALNNTLLQISNHWRNIGKGNETYDIYWYSKATGYIGEPYDFAISVPDNICQQYNDTAADDIKDLIFL